MLQKDIIGYETACGHKCPKIPLLQLLPMVGVVTDHPVFCQQQAGRVLVAGRLQTGSSKVFNSTLNLEKKVLSGRSVGDNTDREQKGSQADKIEVTRHSPDCTLSLSPSPCAYAEASSASVRLRPHAVAEALAQETGESFGARDWPAPWNALGQSRFGGIIPRGQHARLTPQLALIPKAFGTI